MIRSSCTLLQPVNWTAAMTSHLSLSVRNNEMLAVSGSLIGTDTSPFDSTWFTPVASKPPIGASGGGSVGNVGLLKLTEPLTVYLIFDRYWAPMRVHLSGSISTPTFQPQPLSLPVTSALDSRPLSAARSGGITAGGIRPPAAACCAAVAS